MNAPAVEICLYRISENFELTDKLRSGLASAQQTQIQSLSPNRQKEYCVGRLLVAGMLQHFHNLTTGDWLLTERTELPPLLTLLDSAGRYALVPKFSISHSSGIVAVAMMDASDGNGCQLGVDIEASNMRRKLKVADYFFSTQQREESERLSDTGAQHNYLTRVWTQKEAYFKAHELPILNPGLKQLNITRSEKSPAELKTACVEQGTHISVYCNAPYSIHTKWVSFEARGEFARLQEVDLDWQSYITEIDNR